MTYSFLRFTPLYGANSSEAFCYLLTIGTATVLLDCGWKEPYDLTALEPVVKYVLVARTARIDGIHLIDHRISTAYCSQQKLPSIRKQPAPGSSLSNTTLTNVDRKQDLLYRHVKQFQLNRKHSYFWQGPSPDRPCSTVTP